MSHGDDAYGPALEAAARHATAWLDSLPGRHVGPAVEALRTAADRVTPSDASTVLLSNADGAQVMAGRAVLDRLVTQVSNPVRWDLCMQAMADLGVTRLIELAPAGTLVGLAKRGGLKGVQSIALKNPDDLDAARALLAPADDPTPAEA